MPLSTASCDTAQAGSALSPATMYDTRSAFSSMSSSSTMTSIRSSSSRRMVIRWTKSMRRFWFEK